MEFINFSEKEISKIKKALNFISKEELNLAMVPPDLPISKSEDYLTDCEQFIDPERTIGTENSNAAVIFPNNRTSTHKLFLNSEMIKGISYIHSLTNELVVLGNFANFFKDNGHLYTFNPEKILERYYYEYLLWVKFHARKISTRTYTLMSWHEVNGEEPPENGCYRFEGLNISNNGVIRSLNALAACDNVPELRELYWDVLGELAQYFGELTFYQAEPAPQKVDENFPAELLERHLGLEKVLEMYELLQQTKSYDQWQETRNPLRRCIIAMEKQCKEAFKTGKQDA